jgi:hypothetical protein
VVPKANLVAAALLYAVLFLVVVAVEVVPHLWGVFGGPFDW